MRLLILFCVVMISTTGLSQDRQKFLLHGTVVDSVTNGAIPDVHVRSGTSGAISDQVGKFEITVSAGDTIFLSHTSYKKSFFIADQTVPGILVWLSPRVRILHEVQIFPFPTEAEFKEKVLTSVPAISREASVAAENSERMRNMGRFAPMTKTHADLFLESLQGPKDFTFLSSNPSMGIVGLIRSIRRPQNYQYRDWRIPAAGGHPIRVHRAIVPDTVIVSVGADSLSRPAKR